MRGTDSSDPRVDLLHPPRSSSKEGCPNIVILSRPNMATRPRRTERHKPRRLASWNADGVRGRKIELEHFLGQYGVYICLLSETHLNPSQPFRFANYVCHRTDRPTLRGGTAILVRRGIAHHLEPVPGLTHLEAIANQITLAGRPVVVLAAYLSPSHPLIGAELSVCFGGGCWF